MKNQMNGKNGITLIALVISIIVLLILAGVTIATLTGDNGLLQKAQTAKEENEEAKELELIKLAVSAAQVEGKGTITTDNLNKELKDNFHNDESVIEGSSDWYYKVDMNYYKIYKEGKVEKISSEIEMTANIKNIEPDRIVVELDIVSNALINNIRIKDSLNNNIIKYESINKERYKIELNTQINIENDIIISLLNKYYVSKFKLNATRIGGENFISKGLEYGYYAFGANEKYYYKKLSGDQTFSGTVWGDPCPGTPKASYSVDSKIIIYEEKLLNSNIDYLKEMTKDTLSINSYSDGIFDIELNGVGMEEIKNVTIYKNGNILDTGTINNNKFSISSIFNNQETYLLEIVYESNHKYKREINLKKQINVEEKKLGGENIKINTQGKWYYIKFGENERWKYKWVYGNDIEINNSMMGGDPAPGVPKNTYLVDVAEIIQKVTME